MIKLENIPPDEAANIAKIAELTVKQLDRRYAGTPPYLRGVHAKDHGCVTATFKVNANLPDDLRVGVFASPGREYEALIRFSNASVSQDADSPFGPPLPDKSRLHVHGSRGMAIKLLGVAGTPLLPTEGRLTQDFLLINQPVFAFANVEDYLTLSQVLLDHNDDARPFFAPDRFKRDPADPTKPDVNDPAFIRMRRSGQIVGRVQSTALPGQPPPFQPPPASPLDNHYFSAAPFLFGEDRVVKFSAKPEAPVAVDPANLDLSDPRYLRTALRKRLAAPDAGNVVFRFMVQIRTAKELADKIDPDIEDATFEWPLKATTQPPRDGYPFTDVASITIPPQDFETAARRALCESLIFSPWHGVAEHRPLGGINRLRRPVYETSSHQRLRSAGGGGCPMSGIH